MFNSLLDFSLTDIFQTFIAFIAAQNIISQFFKSLSTSFANASPNDNPDKKPATNKKDDTAFVAHIFRRTRLSLWGILFPISGIFFCAYDFDPTHISFLKFVALTSNIVLLIIWIPSYFIIEFMNMK